MAKTKFTKGQTVFVGDTNFSHKTDYENKTDTVEYRVISRVVDACGQKQVTFIDRGHDSVFGRKNSIENSNHIFATAEEAFAYLENQKSNHRFFRGEYNNSVVIYPEVVGDDVWVPSIIS